MERHKWALHRSSTTRSAYRKMLLGCLSPTFLTTSAVAVSGMVACLCEVGGVVDDHRVDVWEESEDVAR